MNIGELIELAAGADHLVDVVFHSFCFRRAGDQAKQLLPHLLHPAVVHRARNMQQNEQQQAEQQRAQRDGKPAYE